MISLHNSKETKAILNAIDDLGHEPVWLRESNLVSEIRHDRTAIEPDVHVAVNRLLLTKDDRPVEDLALASIFTEFVDVLNPPSSVIRAMHKYNAATAMANAGLPVPDAHLALSPEEFDRARSAFESPVVQKKAIGTNGNSMELLDHDEPVSPRMGRRRTFLQEYIDIGNPRPFDIRAYVVGDRLVGAMRREAPAGEWRTNVALGGDVSDVSETLPDVASRLARRATDLFDLDYAGVDLLNNDGDWYVLEVNATAGFKGLYDATGTSVAPYIAQLAIERAGGAVSDGQVERISATLDDGVPSSKPEEWNDTEQTPTVGFTEEITVCGSDGAESVVAKADTGAKRTSIGVELAAAIGAGPVKGTTEVKSALSSDTKTRPLVDVHVGIADRWKTVTASMEDREGMAHPVLIGRDILSDYQVDVGRRIDEE